MDRNVGDIVSEHISYESMIVLCSEVTGLSIDVCRKLLDHGWALKLKVNTMAWEKEDKNVRQM